MKLNKEKLRYYRNRYGITNKDVQEYMAVSALDKAQFWQTEMRLSTLGRVVKMFKKKRENYKEMAQELKDVSIETFLTTKK